MPAAGDSALVQTYYRTGNVKKGVLDVTFDSGDGSFTATALTERIDGFLVKIVTIPGAGVAPDDNYDITITDGAGVDVLQGVGADRDTANTEEVEILYAATGNHPVVAPADTLTLNITGNATNSATTEIILYWTL